MMQQINQTDLFAGTVHAPDAEVVATTTTPSGSVSIVKTPMCTN